MRRSLLSRVLCVALLASAGLVLPAGKARAQSIGINFSAGARYVGETDEPGVEAGANWNNVDGASKTDWLLYESTGGLTTARLSFRAAGTYAFFSTPGFDPGSNAMWQGGIYGAALGNEIRITVTDVPYEIYDVIVYASQDTTATNTLSITDGTTTYYYHSDGRTNAGSTLYRQTRSTDPNNPTAGPTQYQVFPYLTTPSFTLTTGGSIPNVLSNNVFGLQIIRRNLPGIIESVSPDPIPAGSPNFTLTVLGQNFIPGSTVVFNGRRKTTTFVSANELRAAIPATDVVTPGNAAITIATPGGPGSAPFSVLIAPPSLRTQFSVSRSATNQVQVVLTLTNQGPGYAANTMLTTAALRATSPVAPPLPIPLGTIAPGGNTSIVLRYPPGLPPGATTLKIAGSHSSGSFGGTYRITVP